MMFKIEIRCFTTVLRPKSTDIDFTFFLGDGGFEEVIFEEFQVWPICATPEQTVTYTARLQTGEVLP